MDSLNIKGALDLPKYNPQSHLNIEDSDPKLVLKLEEWLLELKTKPSLLIFAYSLCCDSKVTTNETESLTTSEMNIQTRGSVAEQPSRSLLNLCTEIRKDKDSCETIGISYMSLMLIRKNGIYSKETINHELYFVSRMCDLKIGSNCIPIVEAELDNPLTFLIGILQIIHEACTVPYRIMMEDLSNAFFRIAKYEPAKNTTGDHQNQSIMNFILQCSQPVIRFKYSLMLAIIYELVGEWEVVTRGYNICIKTGPELLKSLLANKNYTQNCDFISDRETFLDLLDYITIKSCTVSLYVGLPAYAVTRFRRYTNEIWVMYAQNKCNATMQMSSEDGITVQTEILKRLSRLYFKFSELVEKYDKVHSGRSSQPMIKRSHSDLGQRSIDLNTLSSPSSNTHSDPTEIISKLSNAGKVAIGMVTTFIRSTFKRTEGLENIAINCNVLDPYYYYYLEGIEYASEALYISIPSDGSPSRKAFNGSEGINNLLLQLHNAISIFSANNHTKTVYYLTFRVAEIYRLQTLHNLAIDNYIKCRDMISSEMFRTLKPDSFSHIVSSCKVEHIASSVEVLIHLLGTPASSKTGEYIPAILNKLTEILSVHTNKQKPLEIQCYSKLCPAFFDCNFCLYSGTGYSGEECAYQLTIFRPKSTLLSNVELTKLKLMLSDKNYDHEYINSSLECSTSSDKSSSSTFKLFCMDSVVEKNINLPMEVDLNSYEMTVIERKMVFREPIKLKLLELFTFWKISNTNIVIKYKLDKNHLSESRISSNRKWFLESGRASQNFYTRSENFRCLSDSTEFVITPKILNLSLDIIYECHANAGGNTPVTLKIDNNENIDSNMSVYAELCGDNDFENSHVILSREELNELEQSSLYVSLNKHHTHDHGKLLIGDLKVPAKSSREIPLWIFIPFQAPGHYTLSVVLVVSQLDQFSLDSNEKSDKPLYDTIPPDLYNILPEVYEVYKSVHTNSRSFKTTPGIYCTVQKKVDMYFTKAFQAKFDVRRIPSDHFISSPGIPTESLVYSDKSISPLESGINLEYKVSLCIQITGSHGINIKELTIVNNSETSVTVNESAAFPSINLYCSTTGSKRLFCDYNNDGIIRCSPGILYKYFMKASMFCDIMSIMNNSTPQYNSYRNQIFVKVVWRTTEQNQTCGIINNEHWNVALMEINFSPLTILYPVSIDVHHTSLPIVLKPFDIYYVIYNHTMTTQHIEIKAVQSDNVAFSGYERISFYLLPLSSRKLDFTLLPLTSGSVKIPRIVAGFQSEPSSESKRIYYTTVTDMAFSSSLTLDNYDITIFVLPKPASSS